LQDENVSIYQTGEGFIDLCKGPHVAHAGEIKAFALLSTAGAYWRGDEKNAMLQRIYGTCFPSMNELKEHLKILEEAQKRDHRKLGPQLDLFNFYQDEAGAGLIFYHPNGATVRRIIEDYIKDENLKRGYELVMTPHMLKGKLWEISGHAEHYRENMYYFKVDSEEYAVKPMNCPGHILIYKSRIHSYREMPVRYFELGTVYRQEKAGVLHGLLRVRGFTQDDGHIFCREDQICDEVKNAIDFVFSVMKDFGFDKAEIELSTQPAKFIGAQENWDIATKALEDSLKEKQIDYKVNPGDGAFYGPKIDIKLKDALGRLWQCATIQCDFALPERFQMSYVGEDGKDKRPIMIHRAILGSFERFFGTLVEHYAGAFPLWLAPVQVLLIPIRDEQFSYAKELKENLQTQGFRVIMDARNETLDKRIREGSLKKIPYIVIIGDKEVTQNTVSVRQRGAGSVGVFSRADFMARLLQEQQKKAV
jgi:threonyl-tRNA synthetase